MRRWYLPGGFLLLIALVASFGVVHRRDTRPVNAVGSVESAPEVREAAVLRGESSARSAQEPAAVLPIAVGALVPAAIPSERARVSGLVLDASGGVVGGATLRATSAGQSDTMVSTVSDVEGRFRLGLAAAGVVDIHVSAEAYSDVVVRAQAPVTGLIVALAPASRIVGRVETEEAGVAVAGVTVLASNENGLKLPPRTVQTSADGRFELASLAAGGYSLVAHGATWRSLPSWVSVGVGGTAEALLQVRRASALDGVVNVAGEPCEHGQVVLTGPIPEARALGPGGSVRFEGLFPGHYDVSISCSLSEADGEEAATASPAFAADALGGEDAFEMGSEPVRRVWSLHAPEALPETTPTGTMVVVVRGEQAHVDAVTALLLASGGAVVRGRREGNVFRFAGLEPGDYHAFLEQFPSICARASLPAAGDVDLSLDAPAVTTLTIAGKVSDESGAPVPDAWVHAESATVPASNTTVGSAVLTDGDGAFTLAALPAGSYRIVAEGVLGRASRDRVASGTTKLALTIRESASLSGSVADAEQRAVARFVLNYRLRGCAEVSRIDGHDGRWALPSIAPGTYQLFVIAEQGTGLREITVAPGSRVSTTVTLEAADSQRSMRFFGPSEPQAEAEIR